MPPESGERFVFAVKAHAPFANPIILADVLSIGEVETCVIGLIRYRDGNGRLLETGFLRVYRGADGFVIPEREQHEYQD